MPTRFPHPSNVYRVFLSKDWMAHLCLQPGLRCPATTKVNRAAAETDPYAAAVNALKSLDLIRKVQVSLETTQGIRTQCTRTNIENFTQRSQIRV